jgi:hypothetical protein
MWLGPVFPQPSRYNDQLLWPCVPRAGLAATHGGALWLLAAKSPFISYFAGFPLPAQAWQDALLWANTCL